MRTTLNIDDKMLEQASRLTVVASFAQQSFLSSALFLMREFG